MSLTATPTTIIRFILIGALATLSHGARAQQGSVPFSAASCQMEAATFNIATLQRLAYKEGRVDRATAAARMAATLRDDPCIAAQSNFAGTIDAVVAESLTGASLQAPLDLLTYAGLGLHPDSITAQQMRGLGVRPSLRECQPDQRYVINPIAAWRAQWAARRVAADVARVASATIMWQDFCMRTHVAPIDMMLAAQELVSPQFAPRTVRQIIGSYFH